MLKEIVIKTLTDRFGPLVKIDPTATEFAVFAAKHPAVGNIVIEAEENEITVFIGSITHGHFGSYEDNLSDEEHAAVIASDVVEFLVDLFDDKILLFTSFWGGGWSKVENGFEDNFLPGRRTWFNWSGPIDPTDVASKTSA